MNNNRTDFWRHPRLIVPRTTIAIGDVLTPVMAIRNLQRFSSILFTFLAAEEAMTLTVKTSEDPAYEDGERIWTIEIPIAPLQRTLELGPDQLRTYYWVEGIWVGPGTTPLHYEVRGILRP